MNEKFLKEMELVWGNDQSMIDFCVKGVFEVVELDNDYILAIKKPRIETTFCFGCGQFGNATDEEMKEASNEELNIHKFENFRKANMDHNFGRLKDDVENGKHYMIEFTTETNLLILSMKEYFGILKNISLLISPNQIELRSKTL